MGAIDIAGYIDYTNVRPDATENDILRLCGEAKRYKFASVCVASCWAALAKERLQGTGVRACCVVGFPFGSSIYHAKAFEAREAVIAGADEIDAVINIGQLKSGWIDSVKSELSEILTASGSATIKAIIETCYLTDKEKVQAARLVRDAGIPYVKTSTGYGPSGASLEDVKLIKKEVPGIKIKAAGGIRSFEAARGFLEAGASRIGTSYGPQIIKEKSSRH